MAELKHVEMTPSIRTWLHTSSALCGTLAATLIFSGLLAPTPVSANPSGGVVVDGQATISQQSPTTVVVRQITDRAIIEWVRFSIDTNEHTRFEQPSSASIALNRVTGGNPSEILGRLSGNGQIWLVNPNGIFFGPDAQIDVAGLLATTLDIRNQDFMAGRHVFRGGDDARGTVENRGRITAADAGLVAFVAPGVANHGVIVARLGQVHLSSGNEFIIDLYGDQMINLALDKPTATRVAARDGRPIDSLVRHSGKIFADGGLVMLTAAAAKGIVDRLVNMDGVIEARTVEQRGGEIILAGADGRVEVSGRIEAVGDGAHEKGGRIQVTGDRVGLSAGAVIDASGRAGGGEVLVGGDLMGGRGTAAQVAALGVVPRAKPAVPTATVTYVDAAATVRADATDRGDGGTVVVWADHTTRSHGVLSARGGDRGGDGGLIETSGLKVLQVTGAADAGAPLGDAGTWLLDPTNVRIRRVTTTGGVLATDGIFATGDHVGADLDVDDVVKALNQGTSVTINTNSNGLGSGDIAIETALSKTAGGDASLTLNAERDITVDGAIDTTSGALGVHLNSASGGTIAVNAAISTGNGDFSAFGGSFESAASARFSLGSGAFRVTADHVALKGSSGSVSGSGAAVLATRSDGRTTRIFGAGTISSGTGKMELSQAELDVLSGMSALAVGTSYAAGGIEIAGGVSFADQTTLAAGTGQAIRVSADATIAANGDLYLYADQFDLKGGSGSITGVAEGRAVVETRSSKTDIELIGPATSARDTGLQIDNDEIAAFSGFGTLWLNQSDAGGRILATGAVRFGNPATVWLQPGTGKAFVVGEKGSLSFGTLGIYADKMEFLGGVDSINGSGSLSLMPRQDLPIWIGQDTGAAPDDFRLGQQELAAIGQYGTLLIGSDWEGGGGNAPIVIDGKLNFDNSIIISRHIYGSSTGGTITIASGSAISVGGNGGLKFVTSGQAAFHLPETSQVSAKAVTVWSRDLHFDGTMTKTGSGRGSLSLDTVGSAGQILFSGNVGAGAEADGVEVHLNSAAGGQTTVTGAIETHGAAFSHQRGDFDLAADATIDAGTGSIGIFNADAVSIAGSLRGDAIRISSTSTGGGTTDDVAVVSGGTVDAVNGLSIDARGDVTIDGDLNGSGVSFDAAKFRLGSGAIGFGTGGLSVTADDLDLAGADGTISGAGPVRLEPRTPGQALRLGSGEVSGKFNLSASELARLSGYERIQIGSTTGSGGISIEEPVTFSAETSFKQKSGAIAVTGSGAVAVASGAMLVFDAGSGSITQASGSTMSAGNFALTGNSLSLAGLIEKTGSASGSVWASATAGDIDLDGRFQSAGGLFGLSFEAKSSAGTISLGGSVATEGGYFTASGGQFAMDAGASLSLGNGTLDLHIDDLALASGSTITGSGLARIAMRTSGNKVSLGTATGGLQISQGVLDTIEGFYALEIDGGAVALAGTLRISNHDVGIYAGSGKMFSQAADGRIEMESGNLGIYADQLSLAGGVGSITTGDGHVELSPATPGTAVELGSTTGTGLLISQAAIDTLDGFSLIKVGYSVDTGDLTIGTPVDFHDTETWLIAGSGQTLTQDPSATIDTGSSWLMLSADHMVLAGGSGTIRSSAGVQLTPTTKGAAVDVGTAGTGSLQLDQTALQAIRTSGWLEIGGDRAGPVRVAGQVDLGQQDLRLIGESFTHADGTLDVGGGSLLISADRMALSAGPGAITARGTVFLAPLTDVSIGLGTGTGTLLIDQDALDSLSGYTSLMIGGYWDGGGGTATLSVGGNVAFANDTTLTRSYFSDQTGEIRLASGSVISVGGSGALTLYSGGDAGFTLTEGAEIQAQRLTVRANRITLDGQFTKTGSGDGALILSAADFGGPVILNQAIRSGSDRLSVTLDAGPTRRVEVNADLATGGGDVEARGGVFTVGSGATIDAGSGSIAIESGRTVINGSLIADEIDVVGGETRALVNNGTFEDPVLGNEYVNYSGGSRQVIGWKVLADSIDLKNSGYWQGPGGLDSQTVDLSGNGAGGLGQVMETVAGQRYTVSFDLAGNPKGGNDIKHLQVAACDDSSCVTEDYRFDATDTTFANMGWKGNTFTFTATGAETTLTFRALDDGASSIDAYGPVVDNIDLQEQSAFTLADSGTIVARALEITAHQIAIDGQVTKSGSGPGSVSVSAAGSGGTIAVNGAIRADTGPLQVGLSTAAAGLIEIGGEISTNGGRLIATAQNTADADGIRLESGATINLGSGFAVLATGGGRFVNQSGSATPIVTSGSGRWGIYSKDPRLDTRNGMTADFRRYNCTYSDGCLTPGTTLPNTGNGFFYSIAPQLLVAPGTARSAYGDAVDLSSVTATPSGFVDPADQAELTGTAVFTTTARAGDEVGTYQITYDSGLTSALGYQIVDDGSSRDEYTIDPRTLSLAGLTIEDRDYDGTAVARVSATGSLSGVVGSDAAFLSGTASATFDDANAGTGKPVTVAGLSLTGAKAHNYRLEIRGVTASIFSKLLRVVGVTVADKVYDGTDTATMTDATLSGVVGDDHVVLNGTGATFADEHAGSGKAVTVTGLSLSGDGSANAMPNYTLGSTTTAAGTATIFAKLLKLVGLTVANKVYDGSTAATVTSYGTLTGAIDGNPVTLVTSAAQAAFADAAVGDGKPVNVSHLSLAGAHATDYEIGIPSTTANITPQSQNLTQTIAAVENVADNTATSPITATDTVPAAAAGGSSNGPLPTTESGVDIIGPAGSDTGATVTVINTGTDATADAGADAGGTTDAAANSTPDAAATDTTTDTTTDTGTGTAATAATAQPSTTVEVPVLDQPVTTSVTALIDTPAVQEAAKTLLTAMDVGSVHEAVVELGTGGNLSVNEVKAVFASVPVAAVLDGLAESANETAREVGVTLKSVASGNTTVKFADVRGVLSSSNLAQSVQMAYLALFQRVQKESRTKLFSGALAALDSDEGVASLAGLLGSPLPDAASGPTTRSGTAGLAEILAVPPVARIDAEGRTVIRGTIKGWDSRPLASKTQVFHALLTDAGGQVIDSAILAAVASGISAGDEAPTQRIDGWTGGRQVRIEGRWTFIEDDGDFEMRLPAGHRGPVRLVLIDETGALTEYQVDVGEDAQGTAAGAQTRPPRKVAVLFGNQDYQIPEIPDLDTPPRDIDLVGTTLRNQFEYEVRPIRNATKAQIVKELWRLRNEVGPDDQVIIYYAGHGYEVEKTGTGYWLPIDARTDSAENWISTKEVARLLSRFPAQHILLIADSCYSGAFTKEQAIEAVGSLADLRDRRGVVALSSGGDEPVMDGDVNSPFARALVNRLRELTKVEIGQSLHRKIQADVSAVAPQTPQYGVVASAGYDKGADFLIQPAARR